MKINELNGAGRRLESLNQRSQVLLQAKLGTNLPIGHIHVPRMVGYDPLQLDENFVEFVAILRTLVQAVDPEQKSR